MTHPRNTAGCCDGRGQVHHGEGALSFVTLCPNGCGSKAWDAECEEAERGFRDRQTADRTTTRQDPSKSVPNQSERKALRLMSGSPTTQQDPVEEKLREMVAAVGRAYRTDWRVEHVSRQQTEGVLEAAGVPTRRPGGRDVSASVGTAIGTVIAFLIGIGAWPDPPITCAFGITGGGAFIGAALGAVIERSKREGENDA
jgi:hypothetical protein